MAPYVDISSTPAANTDFKGFSLMLIVVVQHYVCWTMNIALRAKMAQDWSYYSIIDCPNVMCLCSHAYD